MARVHSGLSRAALAAGLLGGCFAAPALAQTAPAADTDTVFILGRLNATAYDSEGQAVAKAGVSAEEMRRFDTQTVDDAIDLIPGANSSNTGGSRNERLIFVRGFDRFQTTLSIDGVRVFLPADNRIDFGRFLTADLAEIQVAKGYVSVLDGPGGLGGSVNLVTRKPSRPFEAELDATVTTGGDNYWTGNTVSALLGTKQDLFYVQASGDLSRRGNFFLSDDFKPVNVALENGGRRENSGSHDWRANFKAGFTPNDTDEYAISYIRQSGEKNAPYHVSDATNTRFWTWPYWDIESIYFISNTQLGPNLNLKTRIYQNKFQNLLSSFDDARQQTQSLPRAFNSYYDDTARGAEATLGWQIMDTNKLTGSVHYREDEHNERQFGYIRAPAGTITPSINAPYYEPWQPTKEDTYSIAVEDVQKLGANIDLVVGAAYNWTDLRKATDVNVSVTGTTIANSVIVYAPVTYPLNDMNAVDGQAALIWRADPNTKLHVSVSDRTRFPTLFERFSSRFGTSIPNPGVKPERATNYEVGGSFDPISSFHIEAAAFYSDVKDALVQVPVALDPPNGTTNQTKNLGDGTYYGAELSATADVADTLRFGANASWIHRELDRVTPQIVGATVTTPPVTTGADPTNPGFELQGVPDFKAFIYADWTPLTFLKITPSVEWASKRYTVSSVALPPTPPATAAAFKFYQTGDYILLNLAADFTLSPNVSLLVGGRNLSDETYTLVDGFPEQGRSLYASVRFRN